MSILPVALRPPQPLIAIILIFAFFRTSVAEGQATLLPPESIPKYASQLVIPPAMPLSDKEIRGLKHADYYEIAVRQFMQQILPDGLPKTTVWSYGEVDHPNTFNFPAFTIEARVDRPVRVKWINGLVDAQGNYLPHLLSVDQTIHWANPVGPRPDSMGDDPSPYLGPVPIVTHVHGAHVTEESDGYPEAWFLPNAKNIPNGYFKTGSQYEANRYEFFNRWGVAWEPGTAIFQYPNDQSATTLWYHDHTLGMTRLNVYAGPAGFYLLRGGADDIGGDNLPGPAPARGDHSGKHYYEIPIVIQDRSFNSDGSLFFPSSRQYFDSFAGPFIPDPKSDIAPIYNPEFFGDTIVVNGKTWPNLNVEPRRYRFRLLDGCNARSLKLKLVRGNPADPAVRAGAAALPFWQIGAEGGFLPAPVKQDQLLITLAERADVIVDFTNMPVGSKITMINRGPDEPINGQDDLESNINTTGQVMQFTVVGLHSRDNSTPPSRLKLPSQGRLGQAMATHKVTLNELDSDLLKMPDPANPGGSQIPVGPRDTLLGILDQNGNSVPKRWSDPITETPKLHQTEIWEIYNFTTDGHPIHIHQTTFEVIDRTPLGDKIGGATSRGPEAWETGKKDTVLSYPGEVTRIKAKFDIPGLYVWHCHIIDHEDNEMMRPLRVIP